MHAKKATVSSNSSDLVKGNGRAWSQSPMCAHTRVLCSSRAGCFTCIILSHPSSTQTRSYYFLYFTGGLGLGTCSAWDSLIMNPQKQVSTRFTCLPTLSSSQFSKWRQKRGGTNGDILRLLEVGSLCQCIYFFQADFPILFKMMLVSLPPGSN